VGGYISLYENDSIFFCSALQTRDGSRFVQASGAREKYAGVLIEGIACAPHHLMSGVQYLAKFC
jgi:hypothetical protein